MEIKTNPKVLLVFVLGLLAVILIFLATMIFAPSANNSAPTDTATVARLSSMEFDQSINANSAVILDVRTPDEFTSGHINNAVNIDFYAADFKTKLDALDKSKPYAVYCRSGNRSAQAVTIMKQLGFKNIVELKGGIAAYTNKSNCTGTC